MNENIIKTTNLSCKSGYRYLLKDVSWEVKKGEHWVVFGMNGSGKTTLLSAVAGFKKHTHGDLKVFGEAYSQENILKFRQRIGWVSSSFFDKYYTQESAINIVLSGKYGTLGIDYNVTNGDIKKAKALLTELHLANKFDQPFNMMSKGERQNVLIARALFSNPDILVLDEPCTGLDVFAREHLLNTVRDLAENTDVTIIYVTHYTEEILDIFQHCLLLRNGRVFSKGLTKDLFNSNTMSEFLGYPVTVSWRDGQFIEFKVEVCSKVRDLLNKEGF